MTTTTTTTIASKTAAVIGVLVLLAAAFLLAQRATTGTTALASAGSCQFQEAAQPVHVAFCDTFDQPAAANATRSGALDPTVWGVSRIISGGDDRFATGTNSSQGLVDNFAPVTMNECGTTVTVVPPKDVAICDGKLMDAVNDDGGQTVLGMYPRQPFDIAGRTGTATFDVGDNSQGPHAAWPTFVYTDQPVPAPYASSSGIDTQARNSFGFTMAQAAPNGCPANEVSIDSMFVTRNYALSDIPFKLLGCVGASPTPTSQSHVEVRISQSQVQVWASDPGSSSLREIAEADNANLTLTRGLVWIEDTHYNADKENSQQSNTFGWDNVGFDGPILPRDLGFDVSDAASTDGPAKRLGWATGSGSGSTTPVTAPSVHGTASASGALVEFNWFATSASVPDVSVNGRPAISTAWPFTDGNTYVWRTIAVPVPLSEIQTGSNTITLANAAGGFANVDIILQGAGGVPTCLDPSNCSSVSSSPGPTSSSSPGPAPTPTATSSSPPTPSATPTTAAASSPTPSGTDGPPSSHRWQWWQWFQRWRWWPFFVATLT